MSARAAVAAITVMRRRSRTCSTSAIAGSCTACAAKGIAAISPMTNAPASSATAKPASTTPPYSAPVRLAQAASCTSARLPRATASGVMTASGRRLMTGGRERRKMR